MKKVIGILLSVILLASVFTGCGKGTTAGNTVTSTSTASVVEATAAPTAEPTVAPTAEPTAEPTAAPTAEATVEPTVAPAAEATAAPATATGKFVLGVNCGGLPSVTIDGNKWLGFKDAMKVGFVFKGASVYSGKRNWITPAPSADVDTMLQSVYYKSGKNLNLTQTIENGSYQFYVWINENYKDNFRKSDLQLEGKTVATAIGTLKNNDWKKYGPYDVTVKDGVLNIDMIMKAGDPQLSGFAIFSK